MQGKLVIFSAPSGAGKTTIVRHLLKKNLNLQFSVSACSREKRKGEINGKDYYFLSTEEFNNKIKKDEFVEWEEVYENHFYGTLKKEIERIWNEGKNVIFDVDVIGGLNIKKQFPGQSLAIFIQPPSVEELEKRLTNRSTDSEKNIRKRIEKAKYELGFAGEFDQIIINDNLEKAKKQAEETVRNFLKSS